MRNGRKLWTLLTITASFILASVLVLVPTVSATAFDGGSGGGSGGGGGSSGGSWGAISRWNYVDTWDQLVNAKYMQVNMNNSGAGARNASEAADWFVRTSSGGQGLLDMCKGPNLVRIYYLGADGGIPIKPNSAGGLFRWGGTAVTGDRADQFAESMNFRGTYVICVINPVERITKPQSEQRARADAATVSGPVAWNTSVAPEIRDAKGKDPIGKDNLHAQMSSKESHYGRLVREIATSGQGNYDAKRVQLEQALARDAAEGHASLDLDAANKEGLAEGGVLSVNEHTNTRAVTLNQNWSESRHRNYTCDYKAGTNGRELAQPANCVYGAWSSWSEDNGTRSHTLTAGLVTPQNTAFWQIVSVHCNPDELDAALAAYGLAGRDYNIISQNRVDDGVTTVLHTTSRSERPTATNGKIFGVNTNTNAALARTGQVGFYDMHCGAQCLTDPNGAGASTANGAKSNLSNTSNRSDSYTKGGAGFKETNSSYFEMFRDNDDRRIKVNTAYPKIEGTSLDYEGQAPIATTVSLWNGSTPYSVVDAVKGGGQFRMSAINSTGTEKLFGGNQKPAQQTNFTLADTSRPVQTFSGPTATKIAGAFQSFDVAATWASEKDAPVVLNVKWEYQPTTVVTFPATVGFDANRGATTVSGTATQKIDVDCYATFGQNDSVPNGYVASRDTGSGDGSRLFGAVKQNTVDANVLAPTMSGSAAHQNEHNLVIRFVRGVAE